MVLLVQDTITLNYTGLRASTRGLGPLKKRGERARGLFVHLAVAFTQGRRPLGVSGLETWAQPETEPVQEQDKESRRWLRGLKKGRELRRASPGDAGDCGGGPRKRHLRSVPQAEPA